MVVAETHNGQATHRAICAAAGGIAIGLDSSGIDEIRRNPPQTVRSGDRLHIARVPAVFCRHIVAQETATGLGEPQQAGDADVRLRSGFTQRIGRPIRRNETAIDQHDAAIATLQRSEQPITGADPGHGLHAGVGIRQITARDFDMSVLVARGSD